MISKALTLAAIAVLGSNVAQAQTTATFSTSNRTFNVDGWTFVYSGNPLLPNTVFTPNVPQRVNIGEMTAWSNGSTTGTTSTLLLPMNISLSTGESINFSLFANTNASAIPYGGLASFDYNLNVSGDPGFVVLTNQNFLGESGLSGTSGTHQSTPLTAPLSITFTLRENRIPEPGAISLLGMGGLAMGGTLLRRKTK
jgi:hypothetical protein